MDDQTPSNGGEQEAQNIEGVQTPATPATEHNSFAEHRIEPLAPTPAEQANDYEHPVESDSAIEPELINLPEATTGSEPTLDQPAVQDSQDQTGLDTTDSSGEEPAEPYVVPQVMSGDFAPTLDASTKPDTPAFPPAPPVSNNPTSVAIDSDYMSNPFLSTVHGLVINLQVNPSSSLLSGIIGVIIGAIMYAIILFGLFIQPGVAVIVGGLFLGVWTILSIALFNAISASSIQGEKLKVSDGYKLAFKKFFPFLGLSLITLAVGFVGLLILIVPGLIFISRSSLAPIVMFSENLGPIASLKRSFKLTKGHANEMLGALFAGAFIGETYYSLLFGAVGVSPMVGRYSDLIQLEKSGNSKPKTHPLNYLYLIGLIFFVAFPIVIIIFAPHHKSSSNNQGFNTNMKNFNYPSGSDTFTK